MEIGKKCKMCKKEECIENEKKRKFAWVKFFRMQKQYSQLCEEYNKVLEENLKLKEENKILTMKVQARK